MTFHFLDFLDPNDGIPTWAIVLAFALLGLAAAMPAPKPVANWASGTTAASTVTGLQLASR